MAKPIVAIVGRPNVGKSTFFNQITGRKISIVDNMPGVTRDRIYADADWNGVDFTLVDTGGLELKSSDRMYMHIKSQAEAAIDTCDCIIFFTDLQSGVTLQDQEIADILRRSKKPVILAVNKMDNLDYAALSEFYALGMGEPYGISSEHGKGTGDLLDVVVQNLKKIPQEDAPEDIIKIAVVGKPNAGKSSIVNTLLGYDRTIVSDTAGTTRDAIDTPFSYGGKSYILIDTAGIRKKANVDTSVEYYSVLRALSAVRRADVCLIVIDSAQDITEQDLKIAGYVHGQGKPSVVVMNKWDLVEKDTHTVNRFEKNLKEELKFMSYFKSMYVSAKTGKRTEKIMENVDHVYERSCKRISTGVLNDMLSDAVKSSEPPSKSGKRLKLYFGTQTGIQPPTFVIKVNDIKLVHFSYERYLENFLRKTFDFDGTPVKLIFRNKNEKE